MNNEKNKKVWLKKCEETLRMGGRSEVTIKNYRYAIIRFLNRYDEKTNISKLTTDDIIKYFKKDFIDKGLSAATYNVNLAAVRFFLKTLLRLNIMDYLPIEIRRLLLSYVES